MFSAIWNAGKSIVNHVKDTIKQWTKGGIAIMALEKLAPLIGSIAGLIGAIVQAVKLGLHLSNRKKKQEPENEKAAPQSSQD